MTNLELFLISPGSSIHQAIACIDSNAKGIALIVERDRKLIATVTDGDIRRAILAGMDLSLPVQALLHSRSPGPRPGPITAAVGTSDAELLRMMNEYEVRHIPIVDDDGHVVDVMFLRDLVKEYELPLSAVVMAGGYGARLRPLTEDVPKPMLPVGDRPLMQLILEQLRQSGIHRVNITTHYQSERISSYFGNGQDFGLELTYVTEDRPLGTAGGLGFVPTSDEPLLVINGDILARVDFRAMLEHHREHGAEMTVAVRQYDVRVPYGVIETEGARARRLREKPVFTFLVNAGIYLLEPAVVHCIPNGQRVDMTDLVQLLLAEGRAVATFPLVGYWLDIGEHGDYAQAQEDVKSGRFRT